MSAVKEKVITLKDYGQTMIPGTQTTLHTLLTDENYTSANQQVVYENEKHALQCMGLLSESLPVATDEEIDTLGTLMAREETLVVHMGLCAQKTAENSVTQISQYASDLANLMDTVGDIFREGLPNREVVQIGRFVNGKPRSAPYELDTSGQPKIVDGQKVPSFKGWGINTPTDRKPNPSLMIQAQQYNYNVVKMVNRYAENPVYSSDEMLSLPLHVGSTQDGKNRLATFPWIGERSRDVNGDSVAFGRTIDNPIGVKASDKITPDELKQLMHAANPLGVRGKLSLIFRMSADKIDTKLTPLLQVVAKEEVKPSLWIDMSHGQEKTHQGKKTREIDDMEHVGRSFVRQCRELDLTVGGISFEANPARGDEMVTECLGINVTDLTKNYRTDVDPCVNPVQAVYLAHAIVDEMQKPRLG